MLADTITLLRQARAGHYAVPAFNISDYSMLLAVADACEAARSPVIVEIHPDELSHVRPPFLGSVEQLLDSISVPAVMHWDHGRSLAEAASAAKLRYGSFMIDGSSLDFSDNVVLTRGVVHLLRPFGIPVEGELGALGLAEEDDVHPFTDPAQAEDFVSQTGVDFLAVAIGTRHGIYPSGMTPRLRLDILASIAARVEIPLVLHGGSANQDNEVRAAIALGVSKVNISSDIKHAYYSTMRRVLRDEFLREPNQVQPACMDAVRNIALGKIHLMGSGGRT